MALKFRDTRLAFVAILLLLAVPLAAQGQQAEKVYRIGYLSLPPLDVRLDSFREGLRDLGYVEGRNIVFEIRSAEGKPDRLPDLAADLVRRKVDLIATATGTTAVAAKKATQTIPIVMLGSGDAVRQGLATSLARPGGNVTGLTMISPELSRKRVELLREMLPQVSRVGVLWCGPADAVPKQEWAETKAAADALGVRLTSLEAHGREDLASAFASAATQRVEAVLGFDCPRLIQSAPLIAQLSLKHRLPGMFPFPAHPRAGSLMSYGARAEEAPRRAATYVDKILKGAKPGELPIEQPTKFELVINLKTARALGLTLPPSLLVRADQVIQ
jgi:putative ABC transport system substrate-binding protein